MDAQINDLLEKYWEGETTVEEENILKSYFQNGQVMPEHEAFTPLLYISMNKRNYFILCLLLKILFKKVTSQHLSLH
ncbi:MAG: hypothetical protein IPK25_11490 [Saprospiraceae bacterium]|nr:hypothetical protein [Saprospiraceae bacterium]